MTYIYAPLIKSNKYSPVGGKLTNRNAKGYYLEIKNIKKLIQKYKRDDM